MYINATLTENVIIEMTEIMLEISLACHVRRSKTLMLTDASVCEDRDENQEGKSGKPQHNYN